MKVSELNRALSKDTLAPLWFITGQEPLLMIEAADAIRAKARALGYEEREVLNASANWDWSQLITSCQSMSLFASQKIVELRLASPRPGTKGAETLSAIAQMPLDGVLLIISMPYDWTVTKLAWYKKLTQNATVVACDPISPQQLPAWFADRLKKQNQSAEPEALKLLAERCEGNLLAAKQELLKLSFQYPEGTTITLEMIEKAVSDVARFDQDNLVDAMMMGEPAKAIRIVQSLKAEGIAIPAFLWVLTDEIRLAARVKSLIEVEGNLYNAMTKAGIYNPDKKKRIAEAIRRNSAKKLASALMLCAQIDKIAKGLVVKTRNTDPWVELISLVGFVAK